MTLLNFADQFLQTILHTTIEFFLIAPLTVLTLRLFNIHHPRLRSCLRLLPLLGLMIAPFSRYLFSNTSIYSCSYPIQKYLIQLLPETARLKMDLYGLKTLTEAILFITPVPLVLLGILGMVGLSIYRLSEVLKQYRHTVYLLNTFRSRPLKSPHRVINRKLLNQLDANKVNIFISDEITVPIAGWRKDIFIPKSLAYTLTQREYESVISHELEHLRWQDNFVRLIFHCVSAIYWWIPLKEWYCLFELEQEMACDRSLEHYGLDGIHLIEALGKSLKPVHQSHLQCAALSKQLAIVSRIKIILNSPDRDEQRRLKGILGFAFLAVCAVLIGHVLC